jgi:hypothetical protein
MSSVQVVHLVRAINGIEPFADLLDSHRRHPAGIEHQLVLADPHVRLGLGQRA